MLINYIKILKTLKRSFYIKNIGFFNSLLQYNFSELRLYHNVNIFVN